LTGTERGTKDNDTGDNNEEHSSDTKKKAQETLASLGATGKFFSFHFLVTIDDDWHPLTHPHHCHEPLPVEWLGGSKTIMNAHDNSTHNYRHEQLLVG
jgi:hypothetical protein